MPGFSRPFLARFNWPVYRICTMGPPDFLTIPIVWTGDIVRLTEILTSADTALSPDGVQ